MTEISLDCKDLPCPQPVLKCKDAIERNSPNRLEITVDNDAAKENVSRFMTVQGFTVKTRQEGRNHIITGTREDDGDCAECTVMNDTKIAATDKEKILVFIASDTIGSGDGTLGGNLMFNFLLTLKELDSDLWRIILVNGGVKLAISDNKCMAELARLEESGVSILVCGTCLEFFGLTDKRGVGAVTNMLDVVTSFQLATKTIQV
ncbi:MULTISPECIES: sulfurtransferase-like selenium metabolism protein YedF [unclassified Pseudodesulfovibrio]|uniref:sulfurtransferase-like selenium metabolism protein YedF n=1 Tax=unclassified Pseudodesulfovibrio TaxID=2661612 RepID=UPI000FEB617E|nr:MULTISPECIES: sulfurtransferase-like selenium metabolism protein YedF [unclassified Pseudodesulfovibrio]MCJ2163829.1 sulfurtransferase-like selenium metabolism protein YedF [Pseudodesulfovibrio sp. S3-i]RWU05924.1 sulfurtransferase-like selenium metabolism protein YedF [Pseudodesulfovibrio sp. S3]